MIRPPARARPTGFPQQDSRRPMNKLSILCLLAVAAPVAAQNDRIYWVDGTVTEKVTVTDFDLTQIKYKSRNGDESASSDRVARLEVEKVQDEYKRAYGAATDQDRYNNFMGKAEELINKPDLFLAQFGLIEAIRLQMTVGQPAEGFAVFDKMLKELPQSGFIPEGYRLKLQYYLGTKTGAPSAKTVAATYAKEAAQNGWPNGYVHEASFYEIMAEAAGGQLQPDALVGKLKSLQSQVEGGFPAVANQVRLQIANVQLGAKQLDEARKIFEDLSKLPSADEATLAGAQLGLGHVYFEQGDPANTEPYRAALLAFLRVYLMHKEAPPSTRAEALYYAAEACDKWRGPDAAAMARRLRGYLRRDFGDSEWAKRG